MAMLKAVEGCGRRKRSDSRPFTKITIARHPLSLAHHHLVKPTDPSDTPTHHCRPYSLERTRSLLPFLHRPSSRSSHRPLAILDSCTHERLLHGQRKKSRLESALATIKSESCALEPPEQSAGAKDSAEPPVAGDVDMATGRRQESYSSVYIKFIELVCHRLNRPLRAAKASQAPAKREAVD